jgi:1-phosphofructokinase
VIYTITLNPAVDKTIILEKMVRGTVNRTSNSFSIVGGKGINVSKTLRSLGIESIASGFLGSKNSSFFIDYLRLIGIKPEFQIIDGINRTNIKIIETQSSIITEINEKGFKIELRDIDLLMGKLLEMIKKDDIVVISGSVPSGTPMTVYKDMIQKFNNKGAITILDSSGEVLKNGIESIPYAVKPNIQELKNIVDLDEDDIGSIVKGGKTLIDRGINKVLISMGGRGAILLSDKYCLFAEPLKVEVENTVGAGDSMVAGIVYAVLKHLNDFELLKIASACGTASVISNRTALLNYKDIINLNDMIKITRW